MQFDTNEIFLTDIRWYVPCGSLHNLHYRALSLLGKYIILME